MGLAPADGHNTAHGSNMRRAHVNTVVGNMEHITQLIQQGVMAADDYNGIFQLFCGAKQADFHLTAGVISFQTLRHFQNAVSFHKGGYNTAAAAQGRGHQLVPHIAHADTDKFLVFQARDNRTGQDCLGVPGRLSGYHQPVINQRFQQLLNDDNAGNGITGNAQNGFCTLATQNGRLTGFHGNAVIQHLAQFPNHSGREVFAAGRRTGI